MQFSLHRPISLISINGNKVSWYPVLSKFISYKPED